MVIKRFTKKTRQNGGGGHVPRTTSKNIKSATKTPRVGYWTKIKTIGKKITPRQGLIKLTGLSKGIASAGLGASRLALSKLGQLGKLGYQKARLFGAMTDRNKVIAKQTGISDTEFSGYEKARKKLQKLESIYGTRIQRAATNEQREAIISELKQARTNFNTASQGIKGKFNTAMGIKPENAAGPKTTLSLSQSAEQIKSNLAKKYAGDHKRLEGELSVLKQKLIEGTQGTSTGYNIPKLQTDIAQKEKEIKGLTSQSGIVSISKSLNKIQKTQNRISRTKNKLSLARLKSNVANVAKKSKEAYYEGATAAQKALGKTKMDFVKALFFKFPASIVSQSFDVLGKEGEKINIKTRYGTIRGGPIIRSVVDTLSKVKGAIFSQKDTTVDLVSRAEKDATNMSRLDENINKREAKINENISSLKREQLPDNVSTALTNMEEYRNKQTELSDVEQKISNLDLQMINASAYDKIALKQQIDGMKTQQQQLLNASLQLRTNLNNEINSISNTTQYAGQLKGIFNLQYNKDRAVSAKNKLQKTSEITSKNLLDLYSSNLRKLDKLTTQDYEDFAKLGLTFDLTREIKDLNSLGDASNELNNIRNKIDEEVDVNTRRLLEGAKNILTMKISNASIQLVSPELIEKAKTVPTTTTPTRYDTLRYSTYDDMYGYINTNQLKINEKEYTNTTPSSNLHTRGLPS